LPTCDPPPLTTPTSASMVLAGSVATRPVKAMEGKTELPFETLYPSAMSPTLSMAIEPIQR
jgi:hypothetical protein